MPKPILSSPERYDIIQLLDTSGRHVYVNVAAITGIHTVNDRTQVCTLGGHSIAVKETPQQVMLAFANVLKGGGG